MKTLTATNGIMFVVDDADHGALVHTLLEARLGLNDKWYVYTDGTQVGRALLDLYGPSQCDHIDGNPLNNCRENLREATRSENQHNQTKRRTNTSGVKGVSWSHKEQRWQVRIKLNGRQHSGGRHATLESAERAAVALRERLHGRFANHG